MAIGRTEFVNRVQSKINEIVQNLALIMYTDSSDMVKSHWKLDLTAPLIDLAVTNLRCRNSEKARKAAILQAYDREDVLKAMRKYGMCCLKFLDEKIETEEDWFVSVNEELNQHLLKFADFCARGLVSELRNYVNSL